MKSKCGTSKKRNKTARGSLICVLLLVVLIAGGVMSIHAYFTDTDFVSNTFAVGNNEIVFSDSGNVTVQNTGNIDCYIRVFAKPENPETAMPAVNTTGWDEDGDYYYYKSKVAPGGTTEPLFTNELGLDEVILYAESIQAIGFSTAQDAFSKEEIE